MFNPYLSCTYINIYFIFSKEKEKGGVACALVLFMTTAVTVALQSVLLHFKTVFPIIRKKKSFECASHISTCGCFQLFHPQYVPKSVLAYIKTTKTKKRHKVEFWWIFLFFLKHYFPKTRQSFFLSITKRNYMCIELVNIQKILFFIST